MTKTKIPESVKEQANKIIADFNLKTYKKGSGIEYHVIYKGSFLYLNRQEGKNDSPISRLKYTGTMDVWDFAIYKWSVERYDPDEFWFPGSQHLNGTIEGALKAGEDAYPVTYKPSQEDVLTLFGQIFGKQK